MDHKVIKISGVVKRAGFLGNQNIRILGYHREQVMPDTHLIAMLQTLG